MHSVRRRSAALAAGAVASALVVVGMLSGCVGGDPKPTPTPTPKATPLYSSDEEALAAAKDAYARYVQVSNEVAHNGWADLSPLKEVATGDALKADQEAGEKNRSNGLRSSGDAEGKVVSVQRVDTQVVTAYACIDVSETRLIDASGADRTPPNRADTYAFEVKLVPAGDLLLIERSDRWSGKSFC